MIIAFTKSNNFILKCYKNTTLLNLLCPKDSKRTLTPAVHFATIIMKTLHIYLGFAHKHQHSDVLTCCKHIIPNANVCFRHTV